MAHSTQLERLAEQRRLLVSRSGELRRQMAQHFAELHFSVAWLDRVYALAQASRAVWPILAGVAGLLLARTGGGLLSKTRRLLSWWRMAKKLTQLYRSFTA